MTGDDSFVCLLFVLPAVRIFVAFYAFVVCDFDTKPWTMKNVGEECFYRQLRVVQTAGTNISKKTFRLIRIEESFPNNPADR